MKISDKGLSNSLPSGPASDAIDERRVNVAEYRQLIGGQAKREGFADDADFPARELLWYSGNKSGLPLLLGVDGECYPFKVLWSVVGFDAVDVVDGESTFIAGNECAPYQSMNEEFFSPPVNLNCDDVVSMGFIGRGQYLVRLRRAVRRSPPTRGFVTVCAPPDAASVRHIENALIASDPIDFFPLFHASPCQYNSGETVA